MRLPVTFQQFCKSVRNLPYHKISPTKLFQHRLFQHPLFQHRLVQDRRVRRGVLCLLLVVVVGLVGAQIRRARARAQQELLRAGATIDKQLNVPFERRNCARVSDDRLRIIQRAGKINAVARYQDSIYLATEGGLVALDGNGRLSHHFTVLDGLPESELTALAYFHNRLFIGTQSSGLVAFNGESFEQFRWPDRNAQSIGALAVEQGRLLIGTFGGGLIEYDGKRFRELKPAPETPKISAINYLSRQAGRLFIGTFNNGLWVVEAGNWQHYTTEQGLRSNRVIGVAATNDHLIVATDFGLVTAPFKRLTTESAQHDNTLFRTLLTLPTLSGITQFQRELLICKDNGELFAVDNLDLNRPLHLIDINWQHPANLHNCQIVDFADSFALITSAGIWRNSIDSNSSLDAAHIALTEFGQLEHSNAPSSNLITALTIDRDARLWAGSFRNGIDIFNADGRRAAHIENQTVREINFLITNQENRPGQSKQSTQTVLAATSQGVISFDAALRAQRISVADGLLSNSVMNIACLSATSSSSTDGNGNGNGNGNLIFATSRGLTIGAAGHLRGITTVQGLPSNNLYSSLQFGNSIYVGTLSGLAEIRDGKLRRVYKDSNSTLSHNWVTAIAVAGNRLFIGTYGGGVYELTSSGELQRLAETAQLTVNANAMFGDDERLYIGTLNGARVYQLASQSWTELRNELPAAMVLSITADDKRVYFGTTAGIAAIEKSYFDNGKE